MTFTPYDRQLARAFKIDLQDEHIVTMRSLEAERDGALELASKAFRHRDAYHRRFTLALGFAMLVVVADFTYLAWRVI